ncbi:hypothetical protein ACRAQ7_05530 [Erythrobacter sp. W53]|uniref:hypothetical protein n=1 Tax=Erythrobacteraceae TaxID=335929 RepID=UPI0036D23721
MFEGRIKPKGYTEEGERPVLREMRWTDLVARLEANRDYRDADDQPCDAGFASFSSLRAFDEISQNLTEKSVAVNHEVLSHGKAPALSNGQPAKSADKSDREKI